jgi:hypothetical protein
MTHLVPLDGTRKEQDVKEDVVERLLFAAKHLRACQRAYMADRGNESLGRAVGQAAEMLDGAIADAEANAA